MNRGPPQQYNPNMNRGPPQQQQQQQQPPQQGYHPQQVQQQQQQQQHAQHPQYRGPPQQQQQQQYNNNARGPPPGRNIHPQHPQYRQQGGQPNYPQGPPQQQQQQQQQQQGGPMPQQHPQYRGPPPQQQYNPNQQPQGNQQQQQVQQQQMSQQQQPQQVGPPGVAPPNGQQLMQQQQQGGDSAAALIKLVQELIHHKHRERALLELSKKREALPDLAPILWHSFGTVAVLLQEIVSIYPLLTPPSLNAHSSNRVCNALALLQCVASHSETRSLFLQAHLPLYLYPFLNTVSKSRPFEYLRLTSLGVIGALVKMDDSEVINFLLQTEIIPLCLRIMETGSELSKTVATFIVQKILLDQVGLNYICATAERFYAVSQVLSNMVDVLVKERSARLLKHIVRCYARLCDNPRARDALRTCLPEAIRDQTFSDVYKTDSTINQWIQKLMHALHGGQ